jgi:hypothetical protein
MPTLSCSHKETASFSDLKALSVSLAFGNRPTSLSLQTTKLRNRQRSAKDCGEYRQAAGFIARIRKPRLICENLRMVASGPPPRTNSRSPRWCTGATAQHDEGDCDEQSYPSRGGRFGIFSGQRIGPVYATPDYGWSLI